MKTFPKIINVIFDNGATSLTNSDMPVDTQMELINSEINKNSEVMFALMAFASILEMSTIQKKELIKKADFFVYEFYLKQLPQMISIIKFNYIPMVLKRLENEKSFFEAIPIIVETTPEKRKLIDLMQKTIRGKNE